MNAMLRYVFTGSAAVAVTMLMFYVMTLLIATDHIISRPSSEQLRITFEDVDVTKPSEWKRPPRPQRPEPRELPPPVTTINTPQPELIQEPLDFDTSTLRNGPGSNIIAGTMPPAPGGQPDGEPFALTTIAPPYPRYAALNRIEGWVTIEFVVTASGLVSDARVVASQPPQVFDDAALKGIRKWKFKPAMRDGQPVARRASQTLTFSLEQE